MIAVLRWLVLVTVVTAAAALIAARVLWPEIESRRAEVEGWLEAQLGQPVAIGELRARWRGWTPELRVLDFRLLDAQSHEPVARFDSALLRLDLRRSLRDATLRLGDTHISGAVLTLSRTPAGTLAVAGVGPAPASAEAPATEAPPERVPGTAPEAPGAVADAPASGPGTRGTTTRARDAAPPEAPAPATAARSGRTNAFAAWLLSHPHLRIDSARLRWIGAGPRPVELTGLELQIRNEGSRHRVSGSGELPGPRGARVGFAADLSGDLLGSAWGGRAFVQGERVALQLLGRSLPAGTLPVSDGVVDFAVTTEWRGARLARAEGELEVASAHVATAGGAVRLSEAGARLVARRSEKGWDAHWTVSRMRLADGPAWPSWEGALQLTRGGAPGEVQLRGSLGYLRLDRLWPLIAARLGPAGDAPRSEPGGAPASARATGALAPAGVLRDFRFLLTLRDGALGDWYLRAVADGLRAPGSGAHPGIADLRARIEAAPQGGRLVFAPGTLALTPGGRLRAPLRADDVRGEVYWRAGPEGWQLQSPDLDLRLGAVPLRLSGSVHGTAGTAPRAELALAIDETGIRDLLEVLPAGLLRPKLASWLDRALPAGRLSDAELRLRGPIASLPFGGPDARMEARFDVSDATLRYRRGWPAIERLAGAVTIRDRALAFVPSAGTVSGATIAEARIEVPDLRARPAEVRVKGRTVGTATQGLRFLRESPLADRLGHVLRGLEASGPETLDLTLRVVLGTRERDVRGTVRLEDNVLRAQRLGVELESIRGALEFDARRVWAQGVTARYLDTPVTVDVLRPEEGDATTRIRMRGTADAGFVARQLDRIGMRPERAPGGGLPAHIEGASPFVALLDLPRPGTAKRRLRVRSALEGLAVTLPEPLAKEAAERRPLDIDVALGEEPLRRVRIEYGEGVRADLRVARGADGGFRAGVLRLGPGEMPALPEQGLDVRGRAARLSVDGWSRFVTGSAAASPAAGPAVAEDAPGPRSPVLRSAHVDAGELELAGVWFEEARLELERDDEGDWAAQVEGETISGEIRVPAHGASAPLVADMDHLRVVPDDTPRERSLDPRTLPPIQFTCRDFTWHSLPLGTVKLVSSPHPQGMRVDALYLFSDHFEARVEGVWRVVDGAHRSAFGLQLSGDDLGAVLTSFGFAGAGVEGGATDIRLDASWPGPPTGLSLEQIAGTLHLKSTDGVLSDVGPGATGRLFGLLMLQSLPRRLKGDFSDLFTRGFSYDFIEGSFSIENGEAFTNNLYMDGPAARIDVAGRTGLVDEDYDQLVTVTPKLSDSWPLAAIWLAEKMLKTDIVDKVFARQYTVTGTWDDPDVEPVEPVEPVVVPDKR